MIVASRGMWIETETVTGIGRRIGTSTGMGTGNATGMETRSATETIMATGSAIATATEAEVTGTGESCSRYLALFHFYAQLHPQGTHCVHFQLIHSILSSCLDNSQACALSWTHVLRLYVAMTAIYFTLFCIA